MKQEAKVVNLSDNSEVFFISHSFKTARQHAKKYMERNKENFPMAYYRLSNKPKPFPKWELENEQ